MGSQSGPLTGGGWPAFGPEPAYVQTLLVSGVAHAGGEGRINVLPWYRPVGVVSTSSKTHTKEDWDARKGKWSPRGTGTTVLTCPCPTASRVSVAVWECARVTGKASENGQNSGNGAARFSWTRPSVLGCGDASKASASFCSI